MNRFKLLKNNSLCGKIHGLCCLYYATSSYYTAVGDMHGFHKSSICRAVDTVSRAIIVRIRSNINVWPEDFASVEAKFYQMARIPYCIGCIDGTYVRMSVSADAASTYMCRKGFTAANLLAICGPERKFYAVDVSCTGAVHDARVLRESGLFEYFTRTPPSTGHLLGDSAYPCTSWLLTPIPLPSNEAERRYNFALARTCVTVENAFGGLKARFPVLGDLRRRSVERNIHVIRATLILHNLCKSMGDRGHWLDVNITAQQVAEASGVNSYHSQPSGGSHRRAAVIRLFEQLT